MAVPVSGEKKHITVLFADVAGSMDLQERLDPEVWAQIMGRFVSILAEGVRRFGGTVDKFTGDGIMALFGAPVAQEDHARRACHAAWYLTKAIGEWSHELRIEQGIDLQVRLGLNSGEVVVGRVGDDVTLDPTALGHTVGLAERVEAMAEPGKAYLTDRTARLVEGWFLVGLLGEKLVKGSRGPLTVYVLAGPAPVPPVLHGAGLGVAPMVGRERELAVLEDALASAEAGHAQVVGVVGEAGLGKSRLCDEFARSVAGRGILLRRAGGVSYGQNVPLLPILAFLRGYFGISDEDDAQAARQKIEGKFLSLDPSLDDALALTFDFLGVPDPQRPVPPMSPEVRMRRIFATIRRVTARRSERETLVLVFEDLHWFDRQSEAFIERLIASFPGSRTLVVTNFRPEFSAPWMRHSYYRQLALRPLEDTAVAGLVRSLLGTDPSLGALLDFLVERTGGNPFFVEEVIRALVEDGHLVGDPGRYRLVRPVGQVKIPANVQSVLTARIDRLPAEQKAVLQSAAVIGRRFSDAVLTSMTGAEAESLEQALSGLCSTELIHQTNRPGEHAFWHALTQEVAYGSLLTRDRVARHAAAAQALMQHEAERLDEVAAVLAWHWEHAEDPFRAAQWSMRAGTWALRTDLDEAERRWRGAVDLLAMAPDSPEGAELAVRARIRLIQWGGRRGADPAEIERLLAEGRFLAERSGSVALQAILIYVWASTRGLLLGDVRGALNGWVEAAGRVETTDEPALICALAGGPILGHILTGSLPDALAASERALLLAGDDPDRGANLLGYSPLVRALSFRADIFLHSGCLGVARDEAERTITLARHRVEPEHLVWSLTTLPRLGWLAGERDDTFNAAAEAIRIGEETGNPMSLVLGYRALAFAHLALGDPRQARAAAERALRETRCRRTAVFAEPEILACLAEAHLAEGDVADAAASAEEAVTVARRQGARLAECIALLAEGHARRAADPDPATAIPSFHAGLALVHQTGALTYEPFIHEQLARISSDEGELREALRLYRRIGATGHARRLEAELSTSATQ